MKVESDEFFFLTFTFQLSPFNFHLSTEKMVVKDKIKALREALEQHNYNYYVLSAPTISDREFDEMMKELQTLKRRILNMPTLIRRRSGWGATFPKSLNR